MTTLDDATIRDLLDFEDEGGVLSFYVGITPDRAADPQPTAPLELRQRIKTLKSELEQRDPDLARRVARRLHAIENDLDRLVDLHASGRGRVLFVGVETGRIESFSLQIPFENRVVHHDGPFVRPLVAALDEGRAAGIIDISRNDVRLLSWAVGEVTELETRLFEVEDDVMARGKHAPVAKHAHHTGGSADRDDFEARLDDNLHRFLRGVVDDVAKLTQQHGWDRVVVAGTPKIREDVVGMLEKTDLQGARVLLAEEIFASSAPHVVAERVWPLLRSVHLEREEALVDATVERALGGHQAAVGLRKVCDALNEGRVMHLLYASDLQAEGYVSNEGTVHPRVEGVMAESDEIEMEREPLFVERMIEKAIATSAAVTPADPDVAGPLQEHEGIGALLRW